MQQIFYGETNISEFFSKKIFVFTKIIAQHSTSILTVKGGLCTVSYPFSHKIKKFLVSS